ncbi:4366_t:CDS:2, partial [Entrophospora sp. SA101]
YHEEWRVYKNPINKGKLTMALYKQLDWFKNEGSEEEKKSAERMLNQFKFHPVATGIEANHLITALEWRWTMVPPKSFHELHRSIDGCIHSFWIKVMAERQVSLKELKVDAEVCGLKAEQCLTITTVATKQVEEYILSTTLDRIEKRPLYTELTTDDEEFDEESMFFEPSNITKIQEIVVETIERTIEYLLHPYDEAIRQKQDEASNDRRHNKTNNHYDAKCTYCNELVSGQPERLKNHIKRCRNVDEKEIDAILAHMIFGLGLPLSLVEAPAFVEFCKKLRPSYKLPSRNT